MGMRSNMEKIPRDAYDTPPRAVFPLLMCLASRTRFIEPCAGRRALVSELEEAGHICTHASDIEPRAPRVRRLDAFEVDVEGQTVITNPPFTPAGELLQHWLRNGAKEVWLLHPLDWFANVRWTRATVRHAREVMPIGRIQWFPGTGHSSTDNFVWTRYALGSGLVWHERVHTPGER